MNILKIAINAHMVNIFRLKVWVFVVSSAIEQCALDVSNHLLILAFLV